MTELMLRSLNRGCLSATPLLGPLALPLFYDKLQAASEKAKVGSSPLLGTDLESLTC